MFKIKICGVKDEAVAAYCAASLVDAIGLNFYDASKRRVDDEVAKKICDARNENLIKVGLFVNRSPQDILRHVAQVGIDAVQLHGDETPEILDALEELPEKVRVIRAIRISPTIELQSLNEIEQWSSTARSHRVGAILLDAHVDSAYGGTGKAIDWYWLNQLKLPTDRPIILAGGLTPENVAEAVAAVKPAGVDVAGGVEDSNGQKSQRLIDQFVSNAIDSFDRI